MRASLSLSLSLTHIYRCMTPLALSPSSSTVRPSLFCFTCRACKRRNDVGDGDDSGGENSKLDRTLPPLVPVPKKIPLRSVKLARFTPCPKESVFLKTRQLSRAFELKSSGPDVLTNTVSVTLCAIAEFLSPVRLSVRPFVCFSGVSKNEASWVGRLDGEQSSVGQRVESRQQRTRGALLFLSR